MFKPSQKDLSSSVDACKIEQLCVAYDDHVVLDEVSFSIPEYSLCAIVGPNGAGKSTLIKTILGLLPTTIGEIKIFNQSIDDVRGRIAYVPQLAMVDWDFPATVYDVIMMGRYRHLGWLSRPSQHDHKVVCEALQSVMMKDYQDRPIGNLSGGQKQRVFLARALAQQADLYVLDEPFVGIDAPTEKIIINLLKDLQQQGKTIIVVHHDLYTVRSYFDSVVLLNKTVIKSGLVADVFCDEYVQQTYRVPFVQVESKMESN
jgi:manganese/zinc/iron transport system ATP- binding protein